MTQKDKQILLKDLCARFPYGVFVKWKTARNPAIVKNIGNEKLIIYREYPDYTFTWESCIEDIKPYLRPMSSMTEEESSEFALLQTDFYVDGILYPIAATNMVKWLNARHFDYRGLIEKGFALEAPKDMYKTEQAMITEDYVSFETAKLLKEKGFDTACTVWYAEYTSNCGGDTYNIIQFDNHNRFNENYKFMFNAPTLAITMKWFREVHHIFIEIDWDARPEPKGLGNKPYFSLIINMNTGDFYKGKDLPSECASYEEACEAAIKYCLENLI